MKWFLLGIILLFITRLASQEIDLGELVQRSTVRISCKNYSLIDSNRIISSGSGTAFIYELVLTDSTLVPLLVTNRHVVEKYNHFEFSVSQFVASGELTDRKYIFSNSIYSSWIYHPDTSIDIAVFPLLKIVSDYNSLNVFPIKEDFRLNDSTSLEINGIENIVMVGYPIGIIDEVNNRPVVRRGITATRIDIDFNGKPIFLIDAPVFHGSSGSPVFILEQGAFRVNNKDGLFAGTRFRFIGILFAGPVILQDGVMKIIDIPTKKDSHIFINLGYCLKPSLLDAFKLFF